MSALEDLMAAGRAFPRTAQGERVSMTWTRPGVSVSFGREHGQWVWVACDTRAGRAFGCGQAATVEQAIEQARLALAAG